MSMNPNAHGSRKKKSGKQQQGADDHGQAEAAADSQPKTINLIHHAWVFPDVGLDGKAPKVL